MTSSTTYEKAVEYVQKRGRLKLLLGTLASQRLKRESDRQSRMVEVEDNAAAKAMGWKQPHSMNSEDDMGDQIVLGDMVQQLPQPKKSSILPALLAGAAIAGIPGAGAVGYLLNQQEPTSVVVPNGQSDVNLGLMRIEELEE